MATLEQQYKAFRNQYDRLVEAKDAWYTIASQKYNEGDTEGQHAAYAEIDKLQEKIDALVNPFEANDQILGEDEGLLKFDS